MNYDKWDMVKKKGVNDDDELNGGEIRKEVRRDDQLTFAWTWSCRGNLIAMVAGDECEALKKSGGVFRAPGTPNRAWQA
eukprot:scaffold3421_cov181-Amphora_coffeaeformis.AAC.10